MTLFMNYFLQNAGYIWMQCVRHFLISFYGVMIACIVCIPLGIYLARRIKLSTIFISLANILQTIPSLALLSILMIFLGLGVNTVIATVFFYSLLPILKNTITAIREVDTNLIDVAKGMGMTNQQILFKVELPLSLSIIMAGIRNAIVIAIGVTAIGTFIGAGGLGDIISRGINVTNGSVIIWAGALPTAFMAVMLDYLLSVIEKKLLVFIHH
ncbi:ABC transporter permease [Anaerorhabdus furcosa]|uniref:Osmoprotectant transport system permease protein n=1 Tax=Anaerorhabdus furcosa TaxID=118967 RepID=A0A1T4NJA4_9FIRM|nr:ABC transporter permease [Anaerorhabdus furcosa]SJZ79339.1 osmoprotectant transport system permease protein [Anaerorhabdus furcosa]